MNAAMQVPAEDTFFGRMLKTKKRRKGIL